MFPVKRVYRKATSSTGRLVALSHSSEGFGGHDISVLFERTASRIYRPACCISLSLEEYSCCLFAEITLPSLWPVEPLKPFLEG